MIMKKRRPKKRESKLVAGVAWYRIEQWQRLREVADAVVARPVKRSVR
jgi:hypothetical protein